MGLVDSPETSVSNHLTPLNKPEDGRGSKYWGRGKLRNEQLYNFSFSQSCIRWAGNVAHTSEMINVEHILVEKL
jgi:hypothetical protein